MTDLEGDLFRSATLLAHALLIAVMILPAAAQEPDENDPAKAAAVLRDAIAARGGDAYLKISSVESHGQYTPFEKAVSGDPMPFVDYVVYPGRERTEFGKGDTKTIQTNSETANWVYDANQRMIRDQKDEQVKQFQQSARYDLDNLLRTGSQQPGVKVVYLGRREAWRNTFSEALRIDFDDGGAATLHLDPRSKLPLMVEYKTVGDEGTVSNEVRFFRWVDYGEIMFPTIQDFYRNGKQSARVTFDTVSFNVSIPDKLFAKPSSIKEVK
jgi:outer membrane lipoprotein-sorting protein